MIAWAMTAAAEAQAGLELQLGWLGLVIPVSGLAITAIVRAFTAKSRVLRDCGDDVASVRDVVLTERVQPVLAGVVVRIQEIVDVSKKKRFLPGEAGDPQIEAQRVLAYNPTFADDYTNLESHFADIHRAHSVHGRRVGHARQIGVAASFFLIAWVYFGFWLVFPSSNFPVLASFAALVIGSAALGWIGSEAMGTVRESNNLSEMARRARRLGGSTR